ncbi:hypothetical protein Glove_207g17 [Diversispora epigaea]|uniref:Uncharacterized protein n=1 Tax=Diversispora epigaea TaxID=1348612 RepID=A0A397IM40_9GLOM|nr:hypothetical protein Glove_207g17 [Diversispora epigaea]
MVSLSESHGTNCTDAEWDKYIRIGIVRDSETPTEENNLLPTESKKYLEARKLVLVPTLGTYAPAIGLAICFSCDQLIFNGDQTAKMSGCNYIGMQKSNSAYTFDDKMHMYQYGLWMQNAIRKIERAREISRKIRAAKVIQQKWIEYMYRPDGLCASKLAIHFKLLWSIREEIRQVNNYFRENNLLPTESKKYLEARKLVLVPTLGTYAPAIGLAICFSCDQLIFNGDQTAKMSGCNYIGMQKSNSAYTFDDKMHMYQYGLWMQNAIRKIERAREISRKIRAAKVIQQKWIEYMYRPDGLCASKLAIHFKLLWSIREEIRQVNNV